MSSIRRQSIISSLVIYTGFGIGILNTYFFTRQGNFTAEQYGLTTIFMAIATLLSGFAMLAMPSFVYKFFHYYKDNLPPRKNDMITWALLVGLFGCLLVLIGGITLKHLVIRKFGANSALLVEYYRFVFPFAFGLSIYTILEAYAWNEGKSVLTNYFREVQWKLMTLLLISLMLFRIIPDFDLFIKLYSFTYPFIALCLLAYLIYTKKIHFTLVPSKVSRRFLKKILLYCSLIYGSTIIGTISQVFDQIVIASVLPNGLDKAGEYGLAFLLTSIIQAPQRGIVSASITHLSRAWKEKNIPLLQRVYQRSSINQLIFSCAVFLLIWLNIRDAIGTFHLKESYYNAVWVFFLLGLNKIIDMGTGVNAQIIATSNYWRFELISGIILMLIILPFTYIFAKLYGITGPAMAGLGSIIIYNAIRIIFLWKKFRLFPFTKQTIYTLLVAAASYFVTYYTCKDVHGFRGLVIRSAMFMMIYVTSVIYLKLTPDFHPVWQTIRKRMTKR
jgi:O-antigen/teichoic acid export membrane protein